MVAIWHEEKLLIDGELVDAAGGATFETISPSTEEVLGVVALEGQGQDELFDLLSGAERPAAGTLSVDGKPVSFRHPADAIRLGMVFVAADRAVDQHLDVAQVDRMACAVDDHQPRRSRRIEEIRGPAGPHLFLVRLALRLELLSGDIRIVDNHAGPAARGNDGKQDIDANHDREECDQHENVGE